MGPGGGGGIVVIGILDNPVITNIFSTMFSLYDYGRLQID